jgi:LPXTG-site transpeptidase (sortase) family protein
VRVAPSSGIARRGTLALVLALLALVLAPSAPAVSPGPEPSIWTGSWAQGWTQDRTPDRTEQGTTARPSDGGRVHVTGVPLSLRIPSLGVAAEVEPVAADGGVLVPPSDPALVGWWAGGALPGSRTGAVVMAGHTVRAGGGVFDDLAAVRPGDVVRVDTPRGSVTYVVAVVRDLSKQQLATEAGELFAVGGSPCVVLVTCADWDDGEYLGNTVVVGVPIDPVRGS